MSAQRRRLETKRPGESFDPPGPWESCLDSVQDPASLQSRFLGWPAAKCSVPRAYDGRISTHALERLVVVPSSTLVNMTMF